MSESLDIRPARPDDLTEVDALFARSYPALLKGHYPPSVLVTAIPLIAKAQPALLATGTYFVVTGDNGQILGAGGWTGVAPGTGRRQIRIGHVRHVVTDHRAVRRGIGKALMNEIIQSARNHGVKRLECLSTLMAVPFYAACGFEEDGPVTVSLRQGITLPAVRMHRG